MLLSICRAKHPVKVHVLAGISLGGATGICIFGGTMDKELFAEILDKTLVPHLHNFETHWFMQDNSPKHMSHYVPDFLEFKCINWWNTPAESPDFNPIENEWHELKEYIHREVKPKTKAELIDGIKAFWATVTVKKCTRHERWSLEQLNLMEMLQDTKLKYSNTILCLLHSVIFFR